MDVSVSAANDVHITCSADGVEEKLVAVLHAAKDDSLVLRGFGDVHAAVGVDDDHISFFEAGQATRQLVEGGLSLLLSGRLCGIEILDFNGGSVVGRVS